MTPHTTQTVSFAHAAICELQRLLLGLKACFEFENGHYHHSDRCEHVHSDAQGHILLQPDLVP